MKFIISIVSFIVGIVVALFVTPFFTEIGDTRINANERNAISATSVTVTGTPSGVADYNLIGFTIANVSASGTVKFPCSMQDDAPNLSAAASASNRWAYASVTDLESGSVIAGNTGIVFTNSTTIRHVAITNSVFKHCTALFLQGTNNVGSTTIKMLPSTNY